MQTYAIISEQHNQSLTPKKATIPDEYGHY